MKIGRPQFLNKANFSHKSQQQIGVLLVNLGSPNQPDASSLRTYLRQFLLDPRVIEFPRWLWFFVLNLIIVPFRSPKSAKAYQEVWTNEGSPLIVNSIKQKNSIQDKLKNLPVVVELGMSYGKPSIPSALRNLYQANLSHLLVLPLYPQYAGSTIGSVFDSIAKEVSTWRHVPHINFVSGYSSNADYINVLTNSIIKHQEQHGKPELLVFSFHGTQLTSLEKGDPYHCQCHRTARDTANQLGLTDKQWIVTFQSRFGRDPWLQPFTIEVMAKLPTKGVTDIQVVCPAFSADCLETLEEIAGENQAEFKKNGGKKFSYIPALNDNVEHINFLTDLIKTNINPWLDYVIEFNKEENARQREANFVKVKPLTTGQEELKINQD